MENRAGKKTEYLARLKHNIRLVLKVFSFCAAITRITVKNRKNIESQYLIVVFYADILLTVQQVWCII